MTLIVLLLSLWLTRAEWLPAMYTYLDVSQPPQSADVIVVLGGSTGWREEYAAQLYQEGYAPYIVISGYPDTVEFMRNVILTSGIPEDHLIIDDQPPNTFVEAQQTLEILLDLDADSALIVTDEHHSRRAVATYHRVFGDAPIMLTFVSPEPLEFGLFDPARWWESPFWNSISAEFIKLPFYWLVYRV